MILSAKQKEEYWRHIGEEILPSFRITALIAVFLVFISGPLPDHLKGGVPSSIINLKYLSILYCIIAFAASYVFPKLIKNWFQLIYLLAVVLIMLPNSIHSGMDGSCWITNDHIINLIHVEVAFTLFLPSSRRYGLATLFSINIIYLFNAIYFSPYGISTQHAPFLLIHMMTMLIICIYGHQVIIRARYKNFSKTLQIEQKNNELLQKNLRLKINPHFIFNALSSIANLIYSKKNTEAHQHTIQFSNLLRFNLEKSDVLYHSLEEEKTFLESYLDLQHYMLSNFSFELTIDPSLDPEDIQIPAFIIQPYVENALIHAFQNNSDHKLWIRITPHSRDYIKIEIEDNGIGRKAAAEKKDSNRKSMGMDITENRIKTLHKNDQIKIQITDLHDNNNQPSGTKVTLITSFENTF